MGARALSTGDDGTARRGERGASKLVRARALDVVKAAYRLDLPPDGWLRELMSAARPSLDRGLGMMAWSFRVGEQGEYSFTSPVLATEGVPSETVEHCVLTNTSLRPNEVAVTFGTARTLGTASSVVEAFHGKPIDSWPMFDRARALGVADCIVAKACDPAGYGLAFCSLLPTVERLPPAQDEQRWARVMTHALAGLRLRDGRPRHDEGEAVLAPSGRVLHAEGEARATNARDALREAAVAIDRARAASGRADPDGALRQWTGLVSGRWSLVDRFDTDGRRFLVARKNDPAVEGTTALTPRERQIAAYAAMGHSNQYIAYALGLAATTVSTHLRTAMRRLGATHRADLAALLVHAPGEGAG